jgi:mannose-1-phosphate guanylyltransferase
LILAGGFGTRLRPLSCTRPKTLFPIVNKPLLEWIFQRLAQDNIKEAILAVNLQTQFHIRKQHIQKHGLHIRYSIDPPKTPLGTGGPIKRAEHLLRSSDPFLVLNGDIFADLRYSEIVKKHTERNALATIALCEVEDPTRYGVADIAKNGQIKRFVEKPEKGKAPTNLINAGIYVLNPEIFNYIPKSRHVSMEREVFPKLAEQGDLFGHIFQGLWIDIGKPEEYLQTNKMILDSLAPMRRVRHSEKFEVINPIAIGKNVSVGEKSVIGPYAIIGKNVTVGKSVEISDSVIFADAKIDDYASVKGTIVGEGATIGKRVKIPSGCIVADQAKIKDNVSLTCKTSVCPAKEVTQNILKSRIIC